MSEDSTAATPTTASDNDEQSGLALTMQNQHQQQQKQYQTQYEYQNPVHMLESVTIANYTLSNWDILSTGVSVLMRALAVYINVRLACDYYAQEHWTYGIWTTVCLVIPLCVTTLIHANMCYQDGKFKGSCTRKMCMMGFVLFSSCFRYGMSLWYSLKCKRAEFVGDKEQQLKYYKLTLREESDVAFIRLFECFMETAPQKILQIAILLAQVDKASDMQVLAICSYFCSMTWCLTAYHRSIRYAQSDKYNINLQGFIAQLCWHFCISVSRTLCIACVASIYPLYTLLGCLWHAIFLGCVTFFVDRPKFAQSISCNLLFCLAMGVVYIFTYIAVRDAPTRRKYCLYYTLCSIENLGCMLVFIWCAGSALTSQAFLFYALCVVAIAFYYIGIGFMIVYYVCYHPRITARPNKRLINNN